MKRYAEEPATPDPTEDNKPSEQEMVQKLEEDPGANWKELYLQPIIRAIRNRLDLDPGQVSLVSPKKRVPYGSDTLGFDIVGHVRFENFVPDRDEFGESPYRFKAHVSVEGNLQVPVAVQGS